MPSTYSDLLRLEKQADGENDTTWGQKANTVFEMIEDSVAGRAAVSMPADANYTLSTANSATDEARCMILNVASGVSLTVTRDVIVPTSAKTYIVKNATSGGQSIRIKTSAGTGITIPNGNTTVVFCDGTNVLQSLDMIGALLLTGALTLSGVLLREDKSTDIVLAATTDLGTATGNLVTVTHAAGNTAITSFGGASLPAGTEIEIHFSIAGGAPTVTHHATNVIVPGAANLDLVTGDTLRLRKVHDSNAEWRVMGGTALVRSGTLTETNKTFTNEGHTTQTLTDGVTIDWNMALGGMATVTLAGNRTLNAPTNLKAGVYVLRVIQDGTGSRTLAFDSAYDFTGNVTPTLTPAINSKDIFTFVSYGSTPIHGSFLPDPR